MASLQAADRRSTYGFPKFWGRDRLIVLYLGRDDGTSALLVSVLGQPFAQGQGRPQLLPDLC